MFFVSDYCQSDQVPLFGCQSSLRSLLTLQLWFTQNLAACISGLWSNWLTPRTEVYLWRWVYLCPPTVVSCYIASQLPHLFLVLELRTNFRHTPYPLFHAHTFFFLCHTMRVDGYEINVVTPPSFSWSLSFFLYAPHLFSLISNYNFLEYFGAS